MRSYAIQPIPAVNSVAVIGNYLPRQCGIATFTTDLVTALARQNPNLDICTIAMNDRPEGYAYGNDVHFEINQQNLREYELAADYLNIHKVDAVCVQHEYGIFGGKAGGYLLKLLSEVRAPIVTTLHTVLTTPTEDYRNVMLRLAEYSERLVVMSHKAMDILDEVYRIPREKIRYIPHGIPDMPFVDPNYYKDQFGVIGKQLLLTFGLLSQNKGIEYAIRALPKVVERHPDIVYMVLGATHPHVVKAEGETYRLQLQSLVRQLGLEKHVVFHNRFVTYKELCEYLAATDIYITPYVNEAQITSGTLAYAMGTGKPVVSTPYWHAAEMLADGRGKLVPFKDSDALADALIDYIDNESERHITRKRAYDFCRSAVWNEVARSYLDTFAEVKHSRSLHPKPYRPSSKLDQQRSYSRGLPDVKLDRLLALTDDTGMLQHAKYTVPDRAHGYCTDDNARALLVTARVQRLLPENAKLCDKLCDTYLAFLLHAFNEERGRFRNFMDYGRRWLEEVGSEDSHGRAVWALGSAVSLLSDARQQPLIVTLFKRAVPACELLTSPRAMAFSLLGMTDYLDVMPGDSDIKRLRGDLVEELFKRFSSTKPEWPWPEDKVTYDNSRLCQALIAAGHALQRDDVIEAGLRSLRWLMKQQMSDKCFVPIGNQGWFVKGGTPARFDQQPLEAAAAVEACLLAHAISQESEWLQYAQSAFNWFLGNNDLNLALYDAKTGGCCDGLEINGVNRNQGAESTLAWLQALTAMHRIYADDTLQQEGVSRKEVAREVVA